MTVNNVNLEADQHKLLTSLCNASRGLSKGERIDFRYGPSLVRVAGVQPREVWIDTIQRGGTMLFGGQMISRIEDIPWELDHDVIFHPGFPAGRLDTFQEDIDALSLTDLIRFRDPDHFFITPIGFDYCRRFASSLKITGDTSYLEKSSEAGTLEPDGLTSMVLTTVAIDHGKKFEEIRLKDIWFRRYGGTLLTCQNSGESLTLTWTGVKNLAKLVSDAEQGTLDYDIKESGGTAVLEILNSESECLYQFVPEPDLAGATNVSVVDKETMRQAAAEIDVLLLSVTEVERDAILSMMQPWPGADVIMEGAITETTYRFGRFGRYRAAHVESTMGTQGRHGVTLTARAALEELRPKAMLLLGIAFGVDRKKQRLGDVIVAETVQPYAYERVGAGQVIPRGVEISCGIDLSERFRTRRRAWDVRCGPRKVEVFQGQMLSGPKLIDDKEFRDALLLTYPNAKGGEMEGEGGYAAAEKSRIQTILIKSICDWADGHKNDRAQAFAAYTSASLAAHVLSQPDVLDVLGANDTQAGTGVPK